MTNSKLREAINEETKWGKTWNGEDALVTTSSKLLDFFGASGSMRNADTMDKLNLFDGAFGEDKDAALKLLFYTRDVRGGYGERDTFNEIFAHLADINRESVSKNLWAVLEFGRAKDLYALIGTKAEEDMWQFMREQFELDFNNMEQGKSVSLLAKWIATPDSKSDNTRALGKKTASKLGYDFKHMSAYKKKLRALRKYLDLPEAKMATGKWDEIEYSKCASKFLLTHRNAFKRHDADRYNEFINKVDSGEEKMHMDVVTPVDIMVKVRNNYSSDLETMWKALPDNVDGNALVMCDTSGSMWGWGYNGNVTPGDVAFALAMYIAERNKGDLKDLFMTFESNPHFLEFKGKTLPQKYQQFKNAPWGGSTDLEAAFRLLLDTAVKHNLAQEDMPKSIIIVSDMQVNCIRGIEFNYEDKNGSPKVTFYDKMKMMYEQKGYNMPAVVFWNVNACGSANYHASASDKGVSMVSGYSTNVLKQVFENIGTTPYELMVKTVLENERYKEIIA